MYRKALALASVVKGRRGRRGGKGAAEGKRKV